MESWLSTWHMKFIISQKMHIYDNPQEWAQLVYAYKYSCGKAAFNWTVVCEDKAMYEPKIMQIRRIDFMQSHPIWYNEKSLAFLSIVTFFNYYYYYYYWILSSLIDIPFCLKALKHRKLEPQNKMNSRMTRIGWSSNNDVGMR